MKRGRAVPLKTPQEIAQMRKAGLLVWQTHQVAANLVRPGITTAAIDAAVETFLRRNNAVPLFKGVPGPVPFPAATCISVNDAIVHGIPGSYTLRAGDVVSIDIGAKLNGWCGDAAVTHAVGTVDPIAERLLAVTEETLRLAIRLIGRKRLWSEVAKEMERFVKNAGFSVVEEMGGHGIGHEMWEAPHVPNYSRREFERDGDFALEPGLVIAVEPMVNAGTKQMVLLPDQWTIVTADGLPSAHFEHTIAITKHGPQVLTAGADGTAWAIDA